MKKIAHKIFASVLAFVVLCSTLSFTIDMHYCGETLIDTAIFQDVKRCEMKAVNASSTTECSLAKKNCCSDEHLVFDGQDELQQTNTSFTLEQQFFITSFAYTYNSLFEILVKRTKL